MKFQKNLRGHTIARLYVKVGEYQSALHYVSLYLSVKEDAAPAHKLQGLCYEKLNKYDKALAAYQRSLQLDPKQPELIIDMCKILNNDELTISPEMVRYVCEIAEAEHINHDAVLNVKLKQLSKLNGNPKPTEELLMNKILQRPLDVNLRVHMVKHMLEQNKLENAFKYCYDLEMKHMDFFSQSLSWYNTVAQVIAKLKPNKQSDWTFWLLAIRTVDMQLALNLAVNTSYAQSNTIAECCNLLFEYDQLLQEITKCAVAIFPERELAKTFVAHYKGQFCLRAATFIFKRDGNQKHDWRDIMKHALPLLLFAANANHINISDNWIRNSIEPIKHLVDVWRYESAFRWSQAGRTLLSCIDSARDNSVMANIRKICIEKCIWTTNDELLNQIRQICSNNEWRTNLFRVIFTNTNYTSKQSTSYLIQNSALSAPIYELPSELDLEAYELLAQALAPYSLQHMVYCLVWCKNYEDPKCPAFKRINLSISNLTNCGAETLNQLDIDACLYAAAIRAKASLDKERVDYESVNGAYIAKPKVMPFAILYKALANDFQSEWWSTAFKTYKNMLSGDDLNQARQELKYGIQLLRGINLPSADLIVLLKVAKIFVNRTTNCVKSVERGFLEARAETIYKNALHLIKVDRILEKSSFKEDKEIFTLAEEAVVFFAHKYFKNEEYDECLETLSNIPLPFATYFQAEANRKLADAVITPKKNKRIYMERVRDLLEKTLDLLNLPHVDKNHALKSIVRDEFNAVQQQLNSADNGNNLVDDLLNESLSTSLSRHRRDDSMQLQQQQHLNDMNQRMNKMMDTLSVVLEKITLIEEQINKRPENNVDSASVLDEYFGIDEELQNQAYINNSPMYQNYGQQQQRVPPLIPPNMHHAQQYNNSLYNYHFALNPYSQGMMPQQPQQQQQQQRTQQTQLPQYAEPNLSYAYASSAPSIDPRNTILGLLTQQPPQSIHQQYQGAGIQLPQHFQQQPPPLQLPSPSLSQQQQQQLNFPSAQPVPATIQPVTPSQNTVPATSQAANTTLDKSLQNSNLLKTWNSSYNNAPVEKGPPINVVITNSDPVPAHTTVTPQQTLSVTIPSYHIKSNNESTIPAVQQPLAAPSLNLFSLPTSNAAATPPSFPSFSAEKPSIFNAAQTVDNSATVPFSIVASTPSEKTVAAPQPKTLFGGISFSSTPISSPAQQEKNTVQEKSKPPNPFSNISFGTIPMPATTAGDTSSPAIKTNPFGSLSSTPLFGSITSSTTTTPFLAPAPSTTTATTTLGSLNTSQPKAVTPSHSEEDAVTDYVPTAEFQPVIALPDLIDVKTGEEDEITKFEHRAKLLRFVKETKEWKERGLGNMKILVHKNDPNKVRLLMRREQVFKLCCNQLLTKDTKFNALPNSATAMSWYGQDYSENELQVEMLAIRFKTADICKQFYDAVLDAQKNMTAEKDIGISDKKPATTVENVTDVKGFGNQFKPASGSWSCGGCYVTNKGTDAKCVACQSPNPSAAEIKSKMVPKPVAPVVSTTGTGFGDKFKPKVGSWECKECYVSNKADTLYCISCDSPKDDTVPKKGITSSSALLTTPAAGGPKFSFGVPFAAATTTAASATTNAFATTTTSTFAFGTFTAMTQSNAASNIFGTALAAAAKATPAVTPRTLNGIEKTNKTTDLASDTLTLQPKDSFEFVFKPKSPAKIKSPLKIDNHLEDVSDDENIEEENNTYFTPVIDLPDKVSGFFFQHF